MIKNTHADMIFNKGKEWQRKKDIKEFIKDLTYIDTVTIPSKSPTNVFTRIRKIKDKWEKK